MNKAQTAQWLREHPYVEDAGLADQLADELDAEREIALFKQTIAPRPRMSRVVGR